MGFEAQCRLTADGQTEQGVARLEHRDLVFRGERRLVIALQAIDEVHSRGGSLFVTFGPRRAVFEIGNEADKWATRIAHPPSRLDKLGVKPHMRVAFVNVDDKRLRNEVTNRGAVIETGSQATGLNVIFFGASTVSDLEELPAHVVRLAPDGAIWLLREKGKHATVSEAQSRAAGKRAGLVDVKVVSVSETHTAEKYVIPVAKRARALRSISAPAHRRGSPPSQGHT